MTNFVASANPFLRGCWYLVSSFSGNPRGVVSLVGGSGDGGIAITLGNCI